MVTPGALVFSRLLRTEDRPRSGARDVPARSGWECSGGVVVISGALVFSRLLRTEDRPRSVAAAGLGRRYGKIAGFKAP